MPELPEVENARKTLDKNLRGKTILSAELHRTDTLLLPSNRQPVFPSRYVGSRRHGKYLILDLESDRTLVSHFRMTGRFYFREPRAEILPHTHVEFCLDDGRRLAYQDVRRFGRLWWFMTRDVLAKEPLSRLGPDALLISEEAFIARARSRNRMMKPLLLDQSVLAGLGNIYVDEALFRARIHPNQDSGRLGKRKLGEFWEVYRDVLERAIESGGSTIRDYVDSEGKPGGYQDRHLVYGKAGRPCPRCDKPLTAKRVSQRGTTYCVRCQRLR